VCSSDLSGSMLALTLEIAPRIAKPKPPVEAEHY
jgi:hypothetical protein